MLNVSIRFAVVFQAKLFMSRLPTSQSIFPKNSDMPPSFQVSRLLLCFFTKHFHYVCDNCECCLWTARAGNSSGIQIHGLRLRWSRQLCLSPLRICASANECKSLYSLVSVCVCVSKRDADPKEWRWLSMLTNISPCSNKTTFDMDLLSFLY